jgi:long-chain acyl-CoA synthetase
MFQICYNYKLYWTKLGYTTPICDKIIFNKIRALLGGKVELILVGGAPLSPQTHEFIRVCLGAILIQGTFSKFTFFPSFYSFPIFQNFQATV